MEQGQLNWVANFIWGIADDVLRDLYVRGKYRDVNDAERRVAAVLAGKPDPGPAVAPDKPKKPGGAPPTVEPEEV